MKYIRTKDGRIGRRCGTTEVSIKGIFYSIGKVDIIKQADTIEELCDELVVKYKKEEKPRFIHIVELLKTCKDINVVFRNYVEWLFDNYKDQLEICNLAIWTDKGLIYVAKLNDKGEWELL